MVISFTLPGTGDIIYGACFEVITAPLSRIRRIAGSGTSLYCCPLCQYKIIECLNLIFEIHQ